MFQIYQITANGHHVRTCNPFPTLGMAKKRMKELKALDVEFTTKGHQEGFLVKDAALSSYYLKRR